MFTKHISENCITKRNFSSINITGKANSMAVCILPLLWVQDESCFDRFHNKGESVCRDNHVRSDIHVEPYNHSTIPSVLAPILGDTNKRKFNNNFARKIVSYHVSNNRLLSDIPALRIIFSFVTYRGDKLYEHDDPLNVVVTKKVKSISRHSSVQYTYVAPYFCNSQITLEGWSPEVISTNSDLWSYQSNSHNQGGPNA